MFRKRVLKIVMDIPKGETLSYKEVAKKAGNERAARAVGRIMNANQDYKVPCHRVIKNDGSIGGYNKGVAKKKELLKEEGYKF